MCAAGRGRRAAGIGKLNSHPPVGPATCSRLSPLRYGLLHHGLRLPRPPAARCRPWDGGGVAAAAMGVEAGRRRQPRRVHARARLRQRVELLAGGAVAPNGGGALGVTHAEGWCTGGECAAGGPSGGPQLMMRLVLRRPAARGAAVVFTGAWSRRGGGAISGAAMLRPRVRGSARGAASRGGACPLAAHFHDV